MKYGKVRGPFGRLPHEVVYVFTSGCLLKITFNVLFNLADKPAIFSGDAEAGKHMADPGWESLMKHCCSEPLNEKF